MSFLLPHTISITEGYIDKWRSKTHMRLNLYCTINIIVYTRVLTDFKLSVSESISSKTFFKNKHRLFLSLVEFPTLQWIIHENLDLKCRLRFCFTIVDENKSLIMHTVLSISNSNVVNNLKVIWFGCENLLCFFCERRWN